MRSASLLAVAVLAALLAASLSGPVAAQGTHPNPPPVSAMNGGFFPPGQILPGASCDNVEHGNLWGWTETIGAGDSQPGPRISTWHITTRNSFSPTHSWWIGNEILGSYDTGVVHRILRSRPIIVSGPPASLSYESFYQTIESEPGWDAADVKLQTSSGLMLVKEIVSWDPEDGAGWLSFAWDISTLAGRTVSIVLEFDTFDSGANTGPGWFVDDICVTGHVLVAPAVGGFVQPVNTFTLVSPWLAVIGLVGCIGVVGVVVKRRRL